MKIPQLKKFKLGKTWVMLSVALGIGLLAALAASSYLSNRVAAIEARAKGKSVNVVVAKSDLAKGVKLTNENVAVRAVPLEFSQSLAVTPDGFDRIDGQVLAYPVKSGEMILWSLLEGKKTPTFSSRVDAGQRAMTVPVDEINSISGLLEPGDVIDLIVTLSQKDTKDKRDKKITFPLLQAVQVMATGQRSVDDPKSGTRREYSTVTLNTTPEQAKNIIVARDAGKITALLRNPQDKQAFGEQVDVAALLGLKGRRSGTNSNDVPVLYGGQSGKIPSDGLTLARYEQGASPVNDGGIAQDVSAARKYTNVPHVLPVTNKPSITTNQ